jgi:hypothetical protein
MNPKTLGTINGEGFQCPVWLFNGRVAFVADLDVDVDGIGESHGDKYYQPETSLMVNGRYLNADIENFIVVPPLIIKSVHPVVLGCKARVTDLRTGRTVEAVVGDVGPTRKTGEASRAVAIALDLDPSPVNGGVDEPCMLYELWPGIAAAGYRLQPS